MQSQRVSILEGNNFVVSDLRGDIDASPTDPQGLFSWDTRYLARWQLLVDDGPLDPLSTNELLYFSTEFFLVPATGSIYTNATMAVRRKRSVGDGFHEDIAVSNYGPEPISLNLRLNAASDFADLFEVKDALAKKGSLYQRVEDGRLVLGYRREGFVRETWISATAPEASLDEHGISFAIQVPSHGEWTTCLEVVTARVFGQETRTRTKYGHGDANGKLALDVGFQDLQAAVPSLVSNWDDLERIYQRSVVDLAALRFFPLVLPGAAIVAAGLPWFMTIFGRDSLIVSLQSIPFAPKFAENSLRILSARQGTRDDPFRDEEPGKILHEQRFGELTAFEERPHSPYYGAADSTPLFLVLLDEYERWTGDRDLVQDLEPAAREALNWIDQYGDRDHDGYVEYERRNPETGLENQCWKDSWNSIQFADGTTRRTAPRHLRDPGLRLRRQGPLRASGAPGLGRRRAGGSVAARGGGAQAALQHGLLARRPAVFRHRPGRRQAAGRQPDLEHRASAVERDRRRRQGPAVVAHLIGERLFSGWGVRSMAVGDAGYNPIGYHLGTIWPHDTALIALGLRRHGYREEATRLALGILEAATFFDGRLPEAFAGYGRDSVGFPVEYPTACSPQAWATGAPLMMLRALLGLEPGRHGPVSDPLLPERVTRLELRGLLWRGRRVDILAGQGAEAAAPSVPPLREPAASAREFFATFERRVDLEQLTGMRATYSFDIAGAGRWRVLVVDGSVHVTESADPADTIFRLPEELLLQMVRGTQNPSTAMLSGRLDVIGDLGAGERLIRAVFPL